MLPGVVANIVASLLYVNPSIAGNPSPPTPGRTRPHGECALEDRLTLLNQSQGGMCICWVLGIGAGVSRECFGP